MAYQLHALIARQELLARCSDVIALPQGVAMVPIVTEGEGGPFPSSEFERLSAEIARLAKTLSLKGIVAYVEAEYFGGAGDQRAVVWENGRVEAAPLGGDAINQVLRRLGVTRGTQHDEFDAVGLGDHRRTEDWLR
jgi:hypothetical protein